MNKAIVLELAKQIASVGGNPLDALKSGTFAPGKIGDPTGKGNTCDDANDTNGCIFTQNLLVPDATDDEINAVSTSRCVFVLKLTKVSFCLQAVGGASNSNGTSSNSNQETQCS